MIEYEIEIKRVIMDNGEIIVFLYPTNQPELTPTRFVLSLETEVLDRLSNASNDRALKAVIREEVIKFNPVHQAKWQRELNSKNAQTPIDLTTLEGEMLATVNQEAIDEVYPPTEPTSDPEVIL